MPAVDSIEWRRRGYIPAGDAARALGMPPISLHRKMDAEEIPFERQGRYRFIPVRDLVRWVRDQYTDRQLANKHVSAVRQAARIKAG